MDDLARLMSDAAGAAQGARREMETVIRSQAERFLADMDVVSREDFEAIKAMAVKTQAENERLSQRVTQLEAELKRFKRWQ